MKTFRLLIAVCLFALNGTITEAQELQMKNNSVSGKFEDEETQQPIADVVVQLIRVKDSSLARTEFTDDEGTFVFSGLDSSQYFIHALPYGYSEYTSEAFTVSENTVLPTIRFNGNTVNLDEVVVQYKKPFLEREHGKVIMNVESSINAEGSSAFELLEKAPGVTVNATDNIAYKGRQGIIIHIDGKPTPMAGTDLANYLRGIPSSAIDKIEFIANPSAKYDAAGSSIINIKLKKDKRLGTNGNVAATYGQGVYPKASSGIAMNHRGKKVNVFGSYNFAYRKGFNNLVLDRDFYNGDTLTGSYVQDNYLLFPVRNHIARAGADFYMNDKNTLGIVVNGLSNKFNPKGENVSDVYDHNNQKESSFRTSNRSRDNWYNYSVNMNYKHIFDSTGTELTTDLDYADFGNNTEQNFTTRYYNLAGNEYKPSYLLYGDILGGLDIYSIKSDLIKPLKNNARIETGLKSSYVVADNNLAFYDKSNGQTVYDSTKSNHFIYKENINAAYFTYTKDMGKWSTQLGLRCENTNVTGNQIVHNERFDTSYVQLFPSGFVGYKINENNELEFNYSRRIHRPSYNQLNPFKFFLDPTTYKEGNPYLKPQTTHAIDLTHVYKQKIFTTFALSRTINNITEVLAPSPTLANTTVQTNFNLGHVDVYSLAFTVPATINKWWTMNTNFNTYYASYNGNIANTPIKNLGKPTFNVHWLNNFAISKTIAAEFIGNYRHREVYAYDDINSIWFLSAGVQKKLWDNKAILKLNITDIPFTNKTTADVTFTNYKERFVVTRDTRVATLSFSYKFGNNNITPGRRRTGGADDVKQRAGNVG